MLNIFPEIAAATGYRYNNMETDKLPFDLCHTPVEPVLKKYAGWNVSLEEALEYEALPVQARAFLQDLEDYLGVPFKMISTGPEREKLIVR